MLTFNCDRPAVDIILGGETTRFEYDVVTLKLEMDRILELSGNEQPGAVELDRFTEFLIDKGLVNCNLDVALRMWSLVTIQFQHLASDIAQQVQELVAQTSQEND